MELLSGTIVRLSYTNKDEGNVKAVIDLNGSIRSSQGFIKFDQNLGEKTNYRKGPKLVSAFPAQHHFAVANRHTSIMRTRRLLHGLDVDGAGQHGITPGIVAKKSRRRRCRGTG